MLWSFVGFVVILSVLLVDFLKKTIDAVKENYFTYPSEAFIDQVLPEASKILNLFEFVIF